jgi:hypothetical protein
MRNTLLNRHLKLLCLYIFYSVIILIPYPGIFNNPLASLLEIENFMSDVLEFDWQPLSALRPLLVAVEGMLEVATSQLEGMSLPNSKASLIEQGRVGQIRNTYAQRQSHLGLYKLQCQRWKAEVSLEYQRQSLNKLETTLAELESIHQHILCTVQGY